MLVQFAFGDPFYSGATERLRFSFFQPAKEKFEPHGFFRVRMRYRFKQFANDDMNAEFLVQFAD